MKRIIICLALTVLMCFAVFISCDEGVKEIPRTAISSPTPEESNATDIDFEYFTCVVQTTENGKDVDIIAKVSEDYCDKLGEKIAVKMKNRGLLEINYGDSLRVKIESIEDTTPLSVNAEYIQVTDCGLNREKYPNREYECPSSKKLTIHQNFPKLNDDKFSWKRREHTGDELLRVVSIENDIVYLSGAFSSTAIYAINGIPDFSFAVGDHVFFEYTNYYYIDNENLFYMFELNDIDDFKVCTENDVSDKYDFDNRVQFDKPVIYLYPEEETECSLRVNLKGELTCTYPEHGEYGWQNFTAMPDGTLIFPDGREYYCLYWEGEADMEPDLTKGFCVKGSDTAEFLADILPKTGLTPREANEFIIFWLPILQKNEYNLITFQTEAYTSIAELEINPNPDSLLRVYMVAKPLDAPVDIEPQTFEGFERKGFTVVEWGGSIMNHKVE